MRKGADSSNGTDFSENLYASVRRNIGRTNRVDVDAVAEEFCGGGGDYVIHPLVVLCMAGTNGRVVAHLRTRACFYGD